MTDTELELCARFLGEPYYFWKGTVPYLDRILHRHSNRPSDADLLLALLERAAELGANPYLSHDLDWFARLDRHTENEVHRSYFDVQKFTATGPTPLAAMTAAVAKYMEAK